MFAQYIHRIIDVSSWRRARSLDLRDIFSAMVSACVGKTQMLSLSV